MDFIKAQELVLIIGMIFLSITSLICLIKAILGPRFTDRVLVINVVNVKIIIMISMLAAYLKKTYIVDIALVYAAVSFISVVVLARIFLKDYLNKWEKGKKEKKDGGTNGID